MINIVKTGVKASKGFSGIFKKFGLLFVVLGIMIIMTIVSPVFLTSTNLLNVLRQVSIYGIMATGMTFVIMLGGIDLSVGSILAVSGVISGSIIVANPNAVFIAIIAAVGASAVFGLFNGFFVAQFKMPAFVATLATMTIARGFSLVYANGRPYILTSEPFKVIGQGYLIGIPIPVIILIVIVALMYILLHKTKFGRYTYAIGGNENAAIMSGVKVKRVKLLIHTLNSALAGVAGVILASRINSGQPAVGVAYEMDVIAGVVIGGTSLAGGSGTMFGTILGTIIIGLLKNSLTLLNVSSYWQQIVQGSIILGAVLLDLLTKKENK